MHVCMYMKRKDKEFCKFYAFCRIKVSFNFNELAFPIYPTRFALLAEKEKAKGRRRGKVG